MKQIDCQHAIQIIDAWIDNELTAEETESLCAHIDICPACKAHSEIESLVKAKIQECCAVQTPPEVRDRIMVTMTTFQLQRRNFNETTTEIRIEFRES